MLLTASWCSGGLFALCFTEAGKMESELVVSEPCYNKNIT